MSDHKDASKPLGDYYRMILGIMERFIWENSPLEVRSVFLSCPFVAFHNVFVRMIQACKRYLNDTTLSGHIVLGRTPV